MPLWNSQSLQAPVLDSPHELWRRWFENFTPPAGSIPLGKRLLHIFLKIANRLAGLLGAPALLPASPLPVPGRCTKPADPGNLAFGSTVLYRAVNEMMAQVLACGMTGLGFIYLDGGRVSDNYPGVTPGKDAQLDIAQGYRPGVGDDELTVSGLPRDDQSVIELGRMQRLYSHWVADLITRLEHAGVWDNTLILWTSELGNPAMHYTHDLPFVLIGGANIPWTRGRYLKRGVVPSPNVSPLEAVEGAVAVAHNHLLVSVLNAMGQPVTFFGDNRFTDGISGL